MIDGLLLDTDVFSFFYKGDSRAKLYAPLWKGKLRCLSFMSAAELERWALRRRWGARAVASLRESMGECVGLMPDGETVRTWARVSVDRQRIGRPIEVGDCWIAATALRHGLPLVTHNAQDFTDIQGLTVISRAPDS